MPSPLAQPPLALIDNLLRRYNGPVPAAELLAALAGEPAGLLQQRAISREIDRAALGAVRSIASHRRRLRRAAWPLRDRQALDELSLSLARYRGLGLRLVASCPLSPRSAG